MIVDSHVTLASDRATPRDFLEAQAANAAARLAAYGVTGRYGALLDQLLAGYQDHDGDRLVGELDGAGIDQAVLVAADYSWASPHAVAPEELARLHHRVCSRHPGRFRVWWGVDPRAGTEGVALFERCVTEYGFAGLKLYPLTGYSPSDRRLYPYFEVCAARGLPVLTHTGPGWGPLDFTRGLPLLVDDAARDFPAVNFVLGHGGVTHVDEAVYLCAHRPNVHLDISQFPSMLSADGWAAHLNRLFRRGVNHKILFGTCWPAFRMSASLSTVVEEFTGGAVLAGVSRRDRQLIMSGNALRLFGEAPTATATGGSDGSRHRETAPGADRVDRELERR
ncbi:amidohydrolase family protein [Micromonospora sp. R77]|uniref:amidohydrolase family protein n=1 Tax=Micromonospora sp. R77 TaxID=2925836 RepID=UPI001F60B1A6|nr:amidohydrolase family protein [Micromonospora sp. R77]MCI4066850.1 amidohydrolase family protein [Micromonospora sp. R77]